MKKLSANNTKILFLLLLAMCFLFVACNNSSVVDIGEIPTTNVSTTATDTTTKTSTTTADSKTTTDKSELLTTTTKITIAPTTKPTSPPKTEKKTTTKPTTAKPTAKPTKAPTAKPTTKPTSPPARTWKYESAMSNELFTLVNNYRVSKGVPALKVDSKCASGAKKRAEYNATNQILSAHEVFQIGAGGALKNPTEIINGWKNSGGHNKNMLDVFSVYGGCAIYSDSNGWLYAIFQFEDEGNWS